MRCLRWSFRSWQRVIIFLGVRRGDSIDDNCPSRYELAIPQRPGDDFDSCWTGWPRALVYDDDVYVLFAAGGFTFVDAGARHFADTGIRRFSLAGLRDVWV